MVTGVRSRLFTRQALLGLLAELAGLLGGSPDVGENDVWRRARAILDQSARRAVSIAELCQSLNLDREHLIRGFRARYGLPPIAYHKQVRLQEAARLLRQTSSAVRTIAEDVGYTNWRSFSRAFAQQWGMPPSDFRDRSEVPVAAQMLLPVNTHLSRPGEAVKAAVQGAVEIEAMSRDDRPSWQADH